MHLYICINTHASIHERLYARAHKNIHPLPISKMKVGLKERVCVCMCMGVRDRTSVCQRQGEIKNERVK